ncbi:hypothetical protein D3C80_1656110 [compost metagenome]
MQRMHMAGVLDRLAGRRQGLAQHLPTVQLAEAQVLATPTEQVLLDGFEAQQVDQVVQHMTHWGFSSQGNTSLQRSL